MNLKWLTFEIQFYVVSHFVTWFIIYNKFYKHENIFADLSKHFEYEGKLSFGSQDRL